MERTLNELGVQKIGQRLVDSIGHAAYTLNGTPKTADVFKRVAQRSTARIFIYFNDTVEGEIANVQLVDTDGDVIAEIGKTFTKPRSKGLYVAFKYDIKEVEVEADESI